jgi:hypothetical protein
VVGGETVSSVTSDRALSRGIRARQRRYDNDRGAVANPWTSSQRSGRDPRHCVGFSLVKKALAIVLIFGFVLVDFLFFHDVFKPGEIVTFPQYLTGVLSIPVVVICALFLLRGDRFRSASASHHQARP